MVSSTVPSTGAVTAGNSAEKSVAMRAGSIATPSGVSRPVIEPWVPTCGAAPPV